MALEFGGVFANLARGTVLFVARALFLFSVFYLCPVTNFPEWFTKRGTIWGVPNHRKLLVSICLWPFPRWTDFHSTALRAVTPVTPVLHYSTAVCMC